MALNCRFVPGVIVLIDGETLIEISESCTTSEVEPVSDPDVAEINVIPELTPVISPRFPAPLLTVAMSVESEVQVTDPVTFAVEPSVYTPVAENCCDAPTEMDALSGLTAIASKPTLVTVRLPTPVTLPRVALMTALPLLIVAVLPLLPGVLLIVATVASDELQ